MFRGLTARRVLVNTTGREAFRGIVTRVGWLHLVLSDLEVLSDAGSGPAEGQARIRRSTVTWIQEL